MKFLMYAVKLSTRNEILNFKLDASEHKRSENPSLIVSATSQYALIGRERISTNYLSSISTSNYFIKFNYYLHKS
jgi:hypothetical protein